MISDQRPYRFAHMLGAEQLMPERICRKCGAWWPAPNVAGCLICGTTLSTNATNVAGDEQVARHE